MEGISDGRQDRKRFYLNRTKRIVEKEENWCQRGYGELADGRLVKQYVLDGVVRFSIEAAIHRSTGFARVVHSSELIEILVETILLRCKGGFPRNRLDAGMRCDLLRIFNRLACHEDVISLLSEAIERI
jgi:hypothetical protein